MKRNQRTLKSPFELRGVGLHTGAEVHLRAVPADPDSGLVFVRSDLPDEPPIPASIEYMDENPRRTALRNGNAEVHTIEHLCAAFHGLGIDNVEIHVDGPELPGMDGSAVQFLEGIDSAGIQEQKAQRAVYVVREPISVRAADSVLTLLPAEGDDAGLRVSYTLNFPGTTIGTQYLELGLKEDCFRRDLAPARTFCFAEEVEQLRERGIGLGANTQNTLVIQEGRPLENEYRFPDELVRHKMLDLVGDISLCGVDLVGHAQAIKTGHVANRMMVRELVKRIEADEVTSSLPSGMEIKEVLNLLPHRYPFLLIDRVLKLEGYRRAVGLKNVTINEPFFQGHFPEQPIMPGVLILEAMAQLAGLLLLRRLENTGKLAVLWSIDKVKLRRAVVPGDQLRIEIEATKVRSKMGQGMAVAKVGPHRVAEALLTFTLVDAD